MDELRIHVRDLEEQTPHEDRASAPTATAFGYDASPCPTSPDVSGALEALRRWVDNLEKQSLSTPKMSSPSDGPVVVARLDRLARDLDALRCGDGFDTTGSGSPATALGSSEYSTKTFE